MNAIEQLKRQIRKEVLIVRDDLDSLQIRQAGLILTQEMSQDILYKESEYILAYASYGSEIATEDFLKKAVAEDKKLFLPKVLGREMLFYRINSFAELVDGYKGILEPRGTTEQYLYTLENSAKTMMLMPGVAFDDEGNRVGYGGGFYDRYLSNKEGLLGRTIAFAYDFQKVNYIPASAYDLKPSKIKYITIER